MIDRRTLLEAFALFALAPAALARARAAHALPALDPALERALAASPFVYVSPLLASGAESTCHGEVWFAWLEGAVLLTTAATGWKARSLARGLMHARLWVGDYGRWKQLVGHNEAFRAAPSFVATAERVREATAIDQLLAAYAKKYPAEIGRWGERMRAGQRDGSRVMIRYRPAPAGSART